MSAKLSKEERKAIEDRIQFLDMRQYAIKIIINSIYGAFGNKYFYFHNNDIAQSITLQGQHLIKFAFAVVNKYFKEQWPTDYELHEKLGILGKKITLLPDDFNTEIYSDTDSVYLNFGAVLDTIEGFDPTDEEGTIFCRDLIYGRLALYLEEAFDLYAKAYGTESRMKFALENISKDGIFVAKKMYCIRITFEDGQLTKKPKLKTRGIDHAKPSWPGWARTRIEDMMNQLMDLGNTMVHEKDIIPTLRAYNDIFKLTDIDDICFNKNVKKYDEYIIDIKKLELTKGIPITARAVAYHNHLIETTGNLKYEKIRTGAKVKMYYAKHPTNDEMDVFAFNMYRHPTELAIPIDYKEQFFRLLIAPMNKLMGAMGMHQLTASLKRDIPVIMPKVRRDVSDAEMYPLWAIHGKTYECTEIPMKLNKYILDDEKEVTETIMDEYIKFVTIYGTYTVICCNMEKDKHIDRMKKKHREAMFKEHIIDRLPPIDAANLKEALAKLKELKFEMDIDETTYQPIFTRKKTENKYMLTYQNIILIKSVEQYVLIMNKIFEQDLLNEANVLKVKEEKAAAKKAKENKGGCSIATELIPVQAMNPPDPIISFGSASDIPLMIQGLDITI